MNSIRLASLCALGVVFWTSTSVPSPSPRGCAAVQDKVVDVRAFGASGDGTSDDTPAVQSAADCAVALFAPDGAGRGGVALYFPKGFYRIRQQIRMTAMQAPPAGGGIVIAGDGADASKLIAGSGTGLFAVTMAQSMSRDRVGLEVRDIGMVAGIANAGIALDVESTLSNNESRGRGGPLITLRIRHLSITAGNASRASFNYGLRATGAFQPFVSDAHMSGAGASACYAFYYSYAPAVDHSSCEGAQFGVDSMYAAEGDMVTASQFSDVGTAVRIQVVPHHVPGPSNARAVIAGNDIAAQNCGINLRWKRFVFIVGNNIRVPANSAFEGISLTDADQAYVSNNTFTGMGNAGTGVVLATDPTSGHKPADEATISGNQFQGVLTAVSIGPGVLNTVVVSNPAWSQRAVQDRGLGTVMLSDGGSLPSLGRQTKPY